MFEKERLELEIEEIYDSMERLKFEHEQSTKAFLRNLTQFELILKEKQLSES